MTDFIGENPPKLRHANKDNMLYWLQILEKYYIHAKSHSLIVIFMRRICIRIPGGTATKSAQG